LIGGGVPTRGFGVTGTGLGSVLSVVGVLVTGLVGIGAVVESFTVESVFGTGLVVGG
jgi:hypothetical protein